MNRIGLVLTGGGGKGAYHIGVWRALREYGVEKNVTSVAGTSVGALNGALFLQGNLELAESVWLSISHDQILSVDPSKIFMGAIKYGLTGKMVNSVLTRTTDISKFGVFSRNGFLELLDKYVDLVTVSKDNRSFYATCCEFPSFQTKHFRLNQNIVERMQTILLATSALPIIFDPVEVDGKLYIDGGVKDNIPIVPLYQEGCRNFIVVHLNRSDIIDRSLFPDANIIEIMPQEDQGGFVRGTMDFTRAGAKRRIAQGYADTERILKPIYQMGLSQSRIASILKNFNKRETDFLVKNTQLDEERQQLKTQLNQILNVRRQKR